MIHKLGKFLQVLAWSVLLLVVTYPLLVIFSFNLFFTNKIYPNLTIVHLQIGNNTKEKALQILQQGISKTGDQALVMNYQDRNWSINLPEIEFTYLPRESIEKAYQTGREQNLTKNILTKWHIWKDGINLPLDYQLNHDLLTQKITSIINIVNVPAIPPTVEVKTESDSVKTSPKKEVKINPGKQGKIVDEAILVELINQRLAGLSKNTIPLPVKEIDPHISTASAEKTKLRAEKLLDTQVKFSFKSDQWLLKDEEIINFLDFQSGFDQEKVASYAAELAKSVDRPPQNALFNFSQGRAIEFKPAKDGQALDQQATINLINKALQELEAGNKDQKIDLPINFQLPQIATKDVNNLGIKELLGTGESWFSGSITSRIHNIRLATTKLNGLLIAPQETFSFNKAVGDISSQTGFQQAYIIKEGRTVLGDGGGVCQVSTTLFRAVLKAGLPITERVAHAYRVAYYEQNSQPGFDATVFDPTEDFKFVNDTPAHILIQAEMDPAKQKLTFYFYGTSDGRVAATSAARVWDQTPPPPDLYQDDPTLPPGAVKQVDWKAWGAKVSFDWTVTRGSDILQKRTFYSRYRPWQAVFLKGPNQ
jgi:vancomycin resistance protein YoaR